MKMKMRALRLTAWQQPPELCEVDVPDPAPGEVLVKVAASGACRSDLHMMDWPAGRLRYKLPFTLGHETAGWVAAAGAGVTGVEIGAPVLVYGAWGCGACRACRLGFENYCEHASELPARGGGLGLDGGMADYMLVPSPRLLVPLGGLDPVEAAPLGDAALTSYHAVKRALPLLVPGSTAVVIGAGGVGHVAVQILRELSPARVVAVDRDPAKLRLAVEVGAHRAVQSGGDTASQVRSATRGRGADVVLDFVGTDATIALGAKIVRAQGQLTVVGLGLGTFSFSFFALPHEVSLATTYWGGIPELHEVLALAQAGRIKVRTERFALGDAAGAYALLRQGALEGRALIVPNLVTSRPAAPVARELQPVAPRD